MNCLEIKNKVKQIIDYNSFPPSIVSNNRSLQNDLGGKKFLDLSDEKQRMIYGDITILNEKAFRYYLFEMIQNTLERKELPPLFDIFLLGLSKRSMSFDNRLKQLSKEEKQIVLEFLECILQYIITARNDDAIFLREDFLQDIKKIIDFWRTVQE